MRYYPLETPIGNTRATSLEMLECRYTAGVPLTADFDLPGDTTRVLRVTFDGRYIVRLLDETAISTDEESPDKDGGWKPDQFAYRVEGSQFEKGQSDIWKSKFHPVSHWRFITAGTCMDVLSNAAPQFSFVRLPGNESA